MKRRTPHTTRPRFAGIGPRRGTVIGLVFAALVLGGCAKKGTPQGGPEDTSGPMIMSTLPGSGDVGVDRVAVVRLEFSESVDRTTLLPNLFVSPPLAGPPDVDWDGRRVTLRWDDSLRENVTYRVTVGGKVSDRHNNPVGDPLTIAFSTGVRIDSSRITGRVFTQDSPAAGMEVFAYRLESESEWGPSTPEFITQTGEDGAFDLPYLPPGRFRLLAIADRNGNLSPDPNERIAIGERDIELAANTTASSIRMFTQLYDTTQFAIRNCTTSDDGSILVGLNASVDTAGAVRAPLMLTDSASGTSLPVEVFPPVPPRFTVIPLTADGLIPGKVYTIRVDTAIPEDSLLFRDRAGRVLEGGICHLKYAEIVDTTGPLVILTVLPNAQTAVTAQSPIVIEFNEPVDTTAGPLLRVRDTLGNPVDGQVAWPHTRRMEFRPLTAWPEEGLIVVTIDSLTLVDRQRNPAPVQTFNWMFAPQTESGMGAAACIVEAPPDIETDPDQTDAYLEARSTPAGLYVRRFIQLNRPFEVELPAGEWIFAAYIDANGDGRHSTGRLSPFEFAEPRVVLADTLSIRARFTVEDIRITF